MKHIFLRHILKTNIFLVFASVLKRLGNFADCLDIISTVDANINVASEKIQYIFATPIKCYNHAAAVVRRSEYILITLSHHS